jgi:hypothetical protein
MGSRREYVHLTRMAIMIPRCTACKLLSSIYSLYVLIEGSFVSSFDYYSRPFGCPAEEYQGYVFLSHAIACRGVWFWLRHARLLVRPRGTVRDNACQLCVPIVVAVRESGCMWVRIREHRGICRVA